MAEEASVKSGKGAMDFLKQKVGPLPLGIWLIAGIVIVLYIREKQGGGSLASLFGGGTSAADQSIDPATGFPSGSAEDQAALAAQSGGGGSDDSGANPTSPGASAFADNNAWARAAINYLVGLGIDPTQANEAIQQYLASQTLSTEQQADVNEAIQALGPPPDLPSATGTPPGTIVGGGTGGTVTVPSVVGKDYEDSAKAITAAGLVVSPPSSNGQSSGIPGRGWLNPVAAQAPAAGAQVSSGSTVTITGQPNMSPGTGGSTGTGTGTSTGTGTGTSTGGGTKSTSGPGGQQYYVNGQPVSLAQYQAAQNSGASTSTGTSGAGASTGGTTGTSTGGATGGSTGSGSKNNSSAAAKPAAAPKAAVATTPKTPVKAPAKNVKAPIRTPAAPAAKK